MGSKDLFKKRREERKRTEPLYFKGIQKKTKEKMDGRIDVVEIPVIDIHGEGCGTGKLIDLTERIARDAKIFYQNIWVVFDKDDFKDFDEAICLGKDKGYKVAWSNQSFEYWLYLHFHYSDSALHRHDWNGKLSEVFKQYNLGDGTYRKNYENIYDLVNVYDGVNRAIKNAKRRMAGFNGENDIPSQFDPGTMVYKLVEDLNQYLKE